MASTTRDNVCVIAPELQSIDSTIFDLILADVATQVGTYYGTQQEIAQRYLAAHLITLSNPGNKSRNPNASGPIERHSVGREEVEYGGTNIAGKEDINSTSYGRRFESIRRQALSGIRVVSPGGS